MSTTHVAALDHSIQTTNQWLQGVAVELGTEDRHYAYRALRSFLHVLRDRLPVAESAQLAGQMPDLVRGIYYEGWRPGHVPQSYRQMSQFVEHVAAEARYHGTTEASAAVDAARAELRRRISDGELRDLAAVLPEDLKPLVRP